MGEKSKYVAITVITTRSPILYLCFQGVRSKTVFFSLNLLLQLVHEILLNKSKINKSKKKRTLKI